MKNVVRVIAAFTVLVFGAALWSAWNAPPAQSQGNFVSAALYCRVVGPPANWVPCTTSQPVPVSGTVTSTPSGTQNVQLVSGYPVGATALSGASGNVANASAAATLTGAASVTTYICGFSLTSSGSTAAAVVSATVAGLIVGTQTYTYVTVAGATLANQPLNVTYTPCLAASAANTNIVVTLPALGAGNTNATTNAWGYRN